MVVSALRAGDVHHKFAECLPSNQIQLRLLCALRGEWVVLEYVDLQCSLRNEIEELSRVDAGFLCGISCQKGEFRASRYRAYLARRYN